MSVRIKIAEVFVDWAELNSSIWGSNSSGGLGDKLLLISYFYWLLLLFCCFISIILSYSFTGTSLVGARSSLTARFLVPKTRDTILGLPLPHMNIVWRCATHASIDMVPASFLSQVICWTLYLLLLFHPLTICLLSKVRRRCTSETLVINNIFYSFLIFKIPF